MKDSSQQKRTPSLRHLPQAGPQARTRIVRQPRGAVGGGGRHGEAYNCKGKEDVALVCCEFKATCAFDTCHIVRMSEHFVEAYQPVCRCSAQCSRPPGHQLGQMGSGWAQPEPRLPLPCRLHLLPRELPPGRAKRTEQRCCKRGRGPWAAAGSHTAAACSRTRVGPLEFPERTWKGLGAYRSRRTLASCSHIAAVRADRKKPGFFQPGIQDLHCKTWEYLSQLRQSPEPPRSWPPPPPPLAPPPLRAIYQHLGVPC